MIDWLVQLGADASCVAETGCPPMTIKANELSGGEASISWKMSSPFLSSSLTVVPVSTGDVTISIKDELISAPDVALTIGLMKKFGVNAQISGDMKGTPSFTIAGSEKYISPESILVEGDASFTSVRISSWHWINYSTLI